MSDMRQNPGAARDLEREDELLLEQVKAVLAPMPSADRRHIAQILAATQERRRTPWQRLFGRLEDALAWWRFSTPPLARGVSLAAVALTIGFVARGYVLRPGTTGGASATSTRVAANVPATDLPVGVLSI